MLTVTKAEAFSIQVESEIVQARQAVRKWCADVGFGLVDQTKIVTAASELARNTLKHGHGGTMLIETIEDGTRKGIRLTFVDQGPGIPNISLALCDGFTTGQGLGLGLGGSKRLMNEFEIESRSGQGTRVMVIKWK
jgi:serine/threonine-protein kinase RsbT